MELCYCYRLILPSLPRLRAFPILGSVPSFSSSKSCLPQSKIGIHWRSAADCEEASIVGLDTFDEPSELLKVAAMEDRSGEEASEENKQSEVEHLLSFLDFKLGFDDTYYILLYGAGALFALWISSAIVGAVDSLPLIPKAMEVVGIGYSIWFCYRYLIFKKSRKELLSSIEELKERIIGLSDCE